MKILTDYHNGSLYESQRLLFEVRLGHELYRQIGTEWFDEGFWKIAEPYGNDPGTISQFLGINNYPWSSETNLNGDAYIKDGIYHIKDLFHNSWQKAVTLQQFKEMGFDMVIASIPAHEEPFKRLRDTYAPNAKHVAQLGNIFQQPTASSVNILDSTGTIVRPDLNVVSYHQEFNTGPFKPATTTRNRIISFMHLLPNSPGNEYWEQLKRELPDWELISFGTGTENGPVQSLLNIGILMRTTKYVFHAKKEGDGYGHIFHNAYCAGKPVITFGSSYAGRQGGKLFEHRVTGIDIDQPDWIESIKEFSESSKWRKMSRDAKSRFKEVVNFDQEAEGIQGWLTNLK